MAAKKPVGELLTALRALTDEQLAAATVRYRFKDGSMAVDAKSIKESLERQIAQARGGRPTKAPAGINAAIKLEYRAYWLRRSEQYPLLVAREQARAWIVMRLVDHRISLATARRWVAGAIGRKKAIPKSYRRFHRRKPR